MKKLLFIISLIISCQAMAEKTTITSAYAFGVSASFKDSVVYFTPIQNVDSLFMNKKTGFILGRENYSYQLKNYVESTYQQKHRTCVFIYDVKKKNIEKKYNKMLEKYKKNNLLIKNIETSDFAFTPVDMSEAVDQSESAPKLTKEEKKKAKEEKKAAKQNKAPAPPKGMKPGTPPPGRP
ncbi:MAG: hypothetical protein Q4F34_01510 [Prevotellaceae bacterium]|nr:hypothetical protein [Prevotellaceae bacterium]